MSPALALLVSVLIVLANAFFVASEFALVSVRKTRIDQLIAEGNRGARAVRRAVTDPDSYIAATQLGITMASIGLGWIGEPTLADAILDRLVHNAHRLTLKGDSLRKAAAKRARLDVKKDP